MRFYECVGIDMSLTSFLKNKDVKTKFKQTYPRLEVRINTNLLAPPLTQHYPLMGTSFDYMMRFLLMRLNPNTISSEWVAEGASDYLLDACLDRGAPDNKLIQKLTYAIDSDEDFDYISLAFNNADAVDNAKEWLSDFIESGNISEELLKSSITLAKLDSIYRAGYIDKTTGEFDELDLKDLKRLISIFKPDDFKSKNVCILNPTFGIASKMVGGADADIVIDDMLIDIKTTKNPDLKEDYFHQLIGYYTLHRIGGIDGVSPNHVINKLGIYSSRYAHLHVIDVQDIIDDTSFPEFLEWFKDKANEIATRN